MNREMSDIVSDRLLEDGGCDAPAVFVVFLT